MRPTPTPAPIVEPTPTPESHDPSQPLDPVETPGSVVDGESTDVRICKKVMSPGGRALERVTRKAGQTVRFRIRVSNLGTNVATDVRVCDILPPGLTLMRAPARPFYVRGRPCLLLPQLTGQREGFITVRIARTAQGDLTNVAEVSSRAGGTRHNAAKVRVRPAPAAGGGVTG